MMWFYIALGIACLVVPSLQYETPIQNMTVTHVWKNLEYGFDCHEDYQYAIQSRTYIEAGFKRPYDADIAVDKYRKVSVFISTPRVVNGIPYTLAKVSERQGKYGSLLLPYPNFRAHSLRDLHNCELIVSVFRIYVDPCNRLWAIDTGRNFSATPSQICPPKILVYDLATNELIIRYELPKEQYIPNQSVHNGIIVDIYDPPPYGRCEKGKAYLTDARGYALVVFDLARQDSWVIYNDLFKPDPAYLNTTIAGETFTFPDGLYTSTPDRKRNRIYLHSYTSVSEIEADLQAVNNPRLWKNNPSGNQDVFKVIGTRKTQSPTQAIDIKGNNIYFSQLKPLSIQSWNPDQYYGQENFKTVAENPETLQFVAGCKVRYNSKAEEVLLTISNRLQKLNTGTATLAEDNYRLMVCKTQTLQTGRGYCGGL